MNNYSDENTEYNIKKFTYLLSHMYKGEGYKLTKSIFLLGSPAIQFRAMAIHQNDVIGETIVIPLIGNRVWNKLGVFTGLKSELSNKLSMCKQTTDTNKIYYYFRCNDYGLRVDEYKNTLLSPGCLNPIINTLIDDICKVGMRLRRTAISHVMRYSDMHIITALEELQIINGEPN